MSHVFVCNHDHPPHQSLTLASTIVYSHGVCRSRDKSGRYSTGIILGSRTQGESTARLSETDAEPTMHYLHRLVRTLQNWLNAGITTGSSFTASSPYVLSLPHLGVFASLFR